MDLLAVIFAIGFGLIVFFTWDDVELRAWFFIIWLFSQLLWFPLFLKAKTEIEVIRANKYENIEFSKVVEITKTRTHKPFSAFVDDTAIKITVD